MAIFNNQFKKINKLIDSKIFELLRNLENRKLEKKKFYLKPGEEKIQFIPQSQRKANFLWTDLRMKKYLTLMITEKCNLRCVYCLRNAREEGKEIPFPVLKRIILSAHRFGIRSFSITGGEPLIYPYWRELMKLIGSLKSSIFLETNGFLLKEDDVKFLKDVLENRITRVLISLDNYKADNHDRFRGRNTFNYAVRAIKLLRRYSIPVEINAILTPFNLIKEKEILNYIKFGKELGVNEIVFDEVVELGRGENPKFLLTENQHRQISQILAKYNYFRDEKGFRVRVNCFEEVLDILPCWRLGQEISVSPYGLHPCVFHIDTIKLGDFKDFEKLLFSDFLNSLYWTEMSMKKCFKKSQFFTCSKCVKYLPRWLSLIKEDVSLYPKQNYEKN